MTSRPSGHRAIIAAEMTTLTGFVLRIFVPDPIRVAGTALMVVGGLAVVFLVGAGLVRSRVNTPLAVVAALCAVGLLGAVAYLHSIADEPSAIPIAGVGVLVLSLVGLLVTAPALATHSVQR